MRTKALLSFGRFLLSPDRKKNFEATSTENLEQRLADVHDADLANWRQKESEKEFAGLTFGEKMVGFTFNPSGDSEVTECKRIFADAIDQIHELKVKSTNAEQMHFCDVAIDEIIGAQMRAVKAITWQN